MGKSLPDPPFVDGNKRTAFAAIYVSLAIIGLDIVATDDEAQVYILRFCDSSSVTFDNLRAWWLIIPRLSLTADAHARLIMIVRLMAYLNNLIYRLNMCYFFRHLAQVSLVHIGVRGPSIF
jgi:hypothetical protein